MNIGNVLNSKSAQLGIGLIVAGVVLYVITTKLGKAAADALDRVNEGTPYEGTGPVGTLGHAADAVSGGLLSDIGSWIGNTLADITDTYDPNAPVQKATIYSPRKSYLRTVN